MEKVYEIWQKITYVDPRSYVCFRVLLGLSIIMDLVFSRLGYVQMFLSDSGAVPRKMLIEFMGFSLFAASGSAIWSYILLIILGIAAMCMIIGLRTTTATVVVYILVLSLHWRIEAVLSGGDRLLLLLLLWAIFLPLGKYGSVDSLHETKNNRRVIVWNDQLAVFGIILITSFMYGIAAWVKHGSSDWYKDFTAVYFVLQTGYHTTWLGNAIKDQLLLTKILTVTTLSIEWLLSVLLFIPFFTQYIRSIFVVLIIILNIGFGSMMSVGLFPILGIAIGMLFVPSGLWNSMYHVQKPTIYLEKIAKKTEWLSAKNLNLKIGPLITLFLVCNIIIQFLVNIDDVTTWRFGNTAIEEITKYYVRILRIDQNWVMFQNAPRWSAWPEVVVLTEQGTMHDMWRLRWQGTDVFSDAPPEKHSDAILGSLRLFNYFDKLGNPENEGNNIHLYYAFYMCRQWNKQNPENFALSVTYYQTFTHWINLNEKEVFAREKQWSYDCPESTRITPTIWYKYM